MIYKTLKKVSDVCQLLDKSKYDVTQTEKGVTFTNNGDGTITANGTSTGGNATFNLQSNITVVAGHKYLVSTDYINQVCIQLYTKTSGIFASYSITNVPQIITCINNYNYVYYQIIFYDGVTVSGAILKPQLFDLTEMYGAGNEPTTVEQFRQDFPEELYDYKPYCFVKSYKTLLKAVDDKIITSYKKSLICTTKNLFDNIPVRTNYVINTNGEEVATPGYNIYDKIYGNNFTISTNAPVDLTHPDNWLRVGLYNSSGTFIVRRDFDFNNRTVVNIVNDNIAYIQLCFSRTSFSNYKLQVEIGSTATEYHPYGYL